MFFIFNFFMNFILVTNSMNKIKELELKNLNYKNKILTDKIKSSDKIYQKSKESNIGDLKTKNSQILDMLYDSDFKTNPTRRNLIKGKNDDNKEKYYKNKSKFTSIKEDISDESSDKKNENEDITEKQISKNLLDNKEKKLFPIKDRESFKNKKFQDLDIKNLVKSYDSLQHSSSIYLLFNIINQDLINTLKYSINYFYTDNININRILLNLEQTTDKTHGNVFYNEAKSILEMNSKRKESKTNFSKNIEMFLHSSYFTDRLFQKTKYNLRSKQYNLESFILKNKIQIKDLLNYTFELISNTTDKAVKSYCIFAINNILQDNIKNQLQKLSKLIIYLYIFNNDKEFYNLDWDLEFLEICSISKYNYKKLLDYSANFSDKNLYYRLYFILISEKINDILPLYNEITYNENQVDFINSSIDVLILVKEKLFNISH